MSTLPRVNIFFSKNAILYKCQIECFLNPKTDGKKIQGKKWGDDDIQMALVIWTMSKPAYRYLRETGILPLPSESYLQKKVQHIKLPPGFLDNITPILRTKAALLPERDRCVHLSMDEVR